MAWTQEKVAETYGEMQRVCMELKGRDQFYEIMSLAEGGDDDRLKAICLIITSLRYAEWVREFAPKQIRELETAGMTLLKICGISPRKSSFDYLYFELILRVAKWFVSNGYFQRAESKIQGISLLSKYASDELRLELDELNSEIYLRFAAPILTDKLIRRYEYFPVKWLSLLLITKRKDRFNAEISKLTSTEFDWWNSYSKFYSGEYDLAMELCRQLQKSPGDHIKILLWAYGLPSKKWLQRSPSKALPKTREIIFGENIGEKVKVLQFIEKLYDFENPLPVRIELCDKIIQALPRLPDLESELLALAAVARFAHRSKQPSVLTRVLALYSGVSLRVTAGDSQGCLGMVTDIYQSFHLKEAATFAVAEIPLVTIMSRRIKQASILSVGASAWVKSLAATIFLSDEKSKKIKIHLLNEFIEKMTLRLDQLKGASLKFGQILSFMFPYLPDDAQKQLAELNSAATPIPENAVKSLVEKELARDLESVFATWDSRAFAAASIGQVHRGLLLNGDDVVTKIQYPDIKSTIDMDISSFRLVTPILNLLFPKIDFDSITREVKIKFEEECDYEHEVKNQQDFQKIFSGDDNILIPNVYLEYSSNKLICSEFMEGMSFDEMLETSDQAEKDFYGELLFRFFVRSLFKKGLCYGDFNPGNFAFQNGKLVVMDFGLVKTMGAKDLEDVRNIFRSVSENKVEKFVQTIESMGFAKKSDGKYDFLKHFELFSETTALPWTDSREFTYNEEFFKKEVEGNIVLNPIGRNISIPDQYFLLMRAYIGIVSLLCKMNATRNWAALFKQESAV